MLHLSHKTVPKGTVVLHIDKAIYARPLSLSHQSDSRRFRCHVGLLDMETALPEEIDSDDIAMEEAINLDLEISEFPQIHLQLPIPSNIQIKSAKYIKSCVNHKECPPPLLPEFAVIGRSNVGKSSIINMLTRRQQLARVSKEPGKTRCINHFLINDSWYLVDLPGYGYAKLSKDTRVSFDNFTKGYFSGRPNLAMVFLLIDGSIAPQPIDVEYANWLTDNEVPFSIVFTKVDKRRKHTDSPAANMRAFKLALLKDLAALPPMIVTSADKGEGRGEMLRFIASLREAFEESGKLKEIKQQLEMAKILQRRGTPAS